MFGNTKLRTKLAAMAAPPMLVLALVAGYGAYVTFLQDSMSSSDLEGDLRLISILAMVGIIASAISVLVVRKRIMAPITEVTAGAVELAENRLPMLIEGLRNPNAAVPDFEPISFHSDNELGELGAALNSLAQTAAEISVEQKNIFKRGISDLVVNLARRNQSLLDRQIESIDKLESNEEDPDRLELLFSLDHLATRMRRNAESLLVLAGAEPARRRGGPIAIADVLRVAMSEIEEYRKVQLSGMEHAEIGAQSAVDLAHLMSELMENATHFSPPDSSVEIKGSLDGRGAYVIGVIDRGIGMNDEQMRAANELLHNPPDLGITTSRSLGFLVMGQLAKRLGVSVELVKTPGSGTTAIVVVPPELLASAARRSVQDTDLDEAPSFELPPASIEPEVPPALHTPISEAPAFEVPSYEEPAFGAGAFDTPAHNEAPAFGAPAFEAPAFEAPAFEAPAFEAPAFEAPAFEAPSFEAPAFEAPAFEAPAFEESAFEAPAFEAPAFEAPAFENRATGRSDVIRNFEQPADTPGAFVHPGEPEPAHKPSADYIPGWDDPLPEDEEPPRSVQEVPFGAAERTDPVAAAFQTPVAPDQGPPSHLNQALPSGAEFDSGVAELLNDSPIETTEAGLVRRDRGAAQDPAPAAGRPVAAGVRSPDEVRNMLARYRSGLKGNLGNGDQQ